MNPKNSASKLLFELGFTLVVFTFAIVIKNFETINWLFIDSGNYHSTKGVVTKSSVGFTGVHGGWRFYIVYEYYEEGIKFTSDRVHFGYQTLSDNSYAQGYVDKYPVGKEILVYFDPDDPSNAVLEPEVKWFGLLNYIFSFTLLSIALFLASWHYKDKTQ